MPEPFMSTVMHRLSKWADDTPDAPAQRFKRDGAWTSLTAREYRDRMFHLALFLESRGIGRGDGGAILSYNCPQWVHLDLATLLLGARSAGIYPNATTKDIHYVMEHTEARVVGVQNRDYFDKITAGGGDAALPERVDLIIVFDDDASVHPKAVAYSEAVAEGRRIAQAGEGTPLEAMLAALRPREDSFLIYTSGTTGNPKGALLCHDNLTFTSDLVAKYWKLPYAKGSLFSFLPLCHIAEKLQSVGVGISQRYLVNYCTRFDQVSAELVEVQPSLLLSVPRLWEKMMEGVIAKVEAGEGLKKKLPSWALGVGSRVAVAKYQGGQPALSDRLQLPLADKLVLSKIRHALGLGNAEILASGAAALPAHVSRWFRALGLDILEDYGQTESTGVITMTEPGVESAGTVGKPLPGMDLRIAEDGEILSRGRHVFIGYYKDDAATAQALEDGWLHTGDLGQIDDRGLLRIRGRKKEIMKTSGGKMVAPLPIEERLKAAPMIGQVCMVGDGRKFLAALITLEESRLAQITVRLGAVSPEGVVVDESVLSEVRWHVDELNKGLAQYEQIKRFTVIGREFSIDLGEMTPTLKMKRNVIEDRLKHVIDAMYVEA